MAASDKRVHRPPDQVSQPPQPPPVQRKLQFARAQLICVPLLMVLPLLALLGLFGETFTTSSTENPQLSMQLEYATRYRYKMVNDLRVSITNLSDQAPVTVTVALDRAYLDNFSNVSFTPSAARITGRAYEVELTDLEAGATQVLSVELRGERYWQHTGMISASIAGGEAVQLEVRTTIWP